MSERYDSIFTDASRASSTLASRHPAAVLWTTESERKPASAAHTVNSDWEQAGSIRAALDRADSGDYGICASCGGPISQLRLIAIPWAHRCAPCQVAWEAGDETRSSCSGGLQQH